jgi:hypothetical protein
MYKRVRAYGHNRLDLFPPGSAARAAFDELDAAMKQVREDTVTTMASDPEANARRLVSRRALVTRLENMSRSARAIAHDHPGFADAFRMPRPRSDESLVLAGHAFLKSAEAARERFASYGLPG